MNQTSMTTRSNVQNYQGFRLLESGKLIAFIQATWHRDMLSQACEAFIGECKKLGIAETHMDFFEVPGILEIPLQSRLLAKTGQYAIVIAAGLIADTGIDRHDFIASTVQDAMMR